MLNIVKVNLNTGILPDKPAEVDVKIMSQDINNNQFVLRFAKGTESVELDDTYTVEIYSKFEKADTSLLTSADIVDGLALWTFDTSFITQDEKVTNYVYVRKSGSLVVSADANAFAFDVGLSEIDKDAGRVAEVYDENYENKLNDFMSDFDEKLSEEVSIQLQSKANKKQEDWIAPTLLNGATPGQRAPRYRKDEFGVVRLSGSVSDVSMNQTLFVLPSGYRPSGILHLPTLHGQFYNRYNDVIRILSNGNVMCWVLSNTTDTQNFSLDGITFVAEG